MENQLTTEQQSKPLTTGLTVSVRKLLKDFPLIRDLKNTVPIKQALAYCFVLTGLKKERYPSEIEEGVLIGFIRDNYPGLVAEELKKAFDLACAGEFKDCETNHYQNFTCAFFGGVMSFYKGWRGDHLAVNQPKTEWTQEQFDNLKFWNDQFIAPIENKNFKFNSLDFLWYDRLRDIDIRCVEPVDMRKFGAMAEEMTPKKPRYKLSEPEETKEQHQTRIVKKAKCLAFKAWVEQIQKDEPNIREIILKALK